MAEVLDRFADRYLQYHRVSTGQLRLIKDIRQCRTKVLGGHKTCCNKCGHIKIHYNSCGNRNCPGCQGVNKEKWILERKYDLLPVPYFHVVFTLPAQLRSICYQNQKLMYNVLFTSAWETMDAFSKDPKHKLKAKMGMIAVLHTWTQQLLYHPHIHCIVPAGGIDQQGAWKSAKSRGRPCRRLQGRFLFPIKALAKTFRGKFMEKLLLLYRQKKLRLKGKIAGLERPEVFWRLKKKLYQIGWVVNTKKPFANPDFVLEYLGRYTHKIAISNYRIKHIDDNEVTFSYLDRADDNKKKTLTLPAEKFIGRFLLHVLPKRFCKIRHYGFLSTRNKKVSLPKIRGSLGLTLAKEKPVFTVKDVLRITKGIDPDICPVCKKGKMESVEEYPRPRAPPIIKANWKKYHKNIG